MCVDGALIYNCTEESLTVWIISLSALKTYCVTVSVLTTL